MVTSNSTVYFITGTNRGIGYGVVQQLAGRPDAVIFATARDPTKADALQQLAKQHSNVHIVQLRVDSDADHAAAVKRVEAEVGRVDVLLANAGIANAKGWASTDKLSVDELREHFEVNTVGPVRVWSAFLPLLQRSSNPKFVVTSTLAGSIAAQAKFAAFPTAHYGSSKAAINFVVQRIHIEQPNITAFPLHPGLVATDMGNGAAPLLGLKEAPVSIEQSAAGIIKLLDESTRATHSGRFWDAVDGSELPW